MKDPNINSTYSPPSHEIIKPKTIKIANINTFDIYNNYFPDNISIPDNLTQKDIEALKEKNQKFYYDYLRMSEKNSLLKLKLQDLINKKNEMHKCLIQMEHKKNKNGIETENNMNILNKNNINNNSIIHQGLINFQSNMYINRKRKRRKKSQIVCNFVCKLCDKKYATEGALNQHVKFKHVQKQ